MANSAEITLILVIIMADKWSVWLAVLYFLVLHLMSASEKFKRKLLGSLLFKFCPYLRSLTLKLINKKYNEQADIFGKPFYCKCKDENDVPGVCPTPSDQGQTDSCSIHAIAKSIVSLLDKKQMDADQDDIVNVLVTNIGSTRRVWPSIFNKKVISIEGTTADDSDRAVKLKVKLSVYEVACPNIIPDKNAEYMLCTTYLSPNDLNAVYIEMKNEVTGQLTCINSWGQTANPNPIVLKDHPSNMFFKIAMKIETDPGQCKNCNLERMISEACGNALTNDLFETRRGKRNANAVYLSDGSPLKTIFESMQRFENDEMSLTARLEKLEEKEKNFPVYMSKMTSKMTKDIILPVETKASQVMAQQHDSPLMRG